MRNAIASHLFFALLALSTSTTAHAQSDCLELGCTVWQMKVITPYPAITGATISGDLPDEPGDGSCICDGGLCIDHSDPCSQTMVYVFNAGTNRVLCSPTTSQTGSIPADAVGSQQATVTLSVSECGDFQWAQMTVHDNTCNNNLVGTVTVEIGCYDCSEESCQ
ncbi:MAG: hypothetical protein U1E73_09530 [Planctomycetota bacterium]